MPRCRGGDRPPAYRVASVLPATGPVAEPVTSIVVPAVPSGTLKVEVGGAEVPIVTDAICGPYACR